MKAPATNKILLVIPFWEGDKPQAMKLAKLLADLEPKHSDQADLLFVSRFDCAHDIAAEKLVSRKFNTFSYTSKRRGTGWPMGCNALFFGAMEWAFHKVNAGQVPAYKAVLILAGDGAPLQKDWLSFFLAEVGQAAVAGALIESVPGFDGYPHINGDTMLLSGDVEFLRWLALGVGDISTVVGWDWALAPAFKARGWKNLPFVKSGWNKRTPFTDEEWSGQQAAGVVWFHGQKGNSLLDLARKKLL